MIVLDASVLIAHFEPADAHHPRAGALLREHAEHDFWANTVTLAEFLVGPTRRGTVAIARQGITDLDIAAHGINADGWLALAELRANTGRKMPDCCVLYTAIELGSSDAKIATFDDALAATARNLGIDVVGSSGVNS